MRVIITTEGKGLALWTPGGRWLHLTPDEVVELIHALNDIQVIHTQKSSTLTLERR